ncbi:FUSC family protein [Litorisediminicola beolgyonensis]|uniref:FUSC family protein n=1 Tax=Litorisediminicola beolgyonensis TaxID=1173614 RepID=A0ABW3ZL86_9RHOB
MQALKTFFVDGDTPMNWRDVAVMLAAIAVPPLIGVMLFGRIGAVAFVAALPAHIAARDAGLQPAVVVTLVTGMAGMLVLGEPSLALPVAAALAAMTSIACQHGFAMPCLRALFIWTIFTGPILPTEDLSGLFLIYLVAMGWSLGVTLIFFEVSELTRAERSSRTYSAAFGAALGVGLVISIWVGRHFFGEHGFWFPLTFVVLWLPPFGELFSRTAKRTVGTIIGTAISLVIALWIKLPWVSGVMGALALALAFRLLPRSYVFFTACLTVTVLEALSLVSDLDHLATERITTMFAAAVMTGLLGLLTFGALRVLHPEAFRELMETAPYD